jgi:RHS repeat-associated protein
MNARQPTTTQSYGYDGAYASFQVTGTPFLGYDAFATCLKAPSFEASAGKFRQFTGKERDSESGLDYFGARYYGSALGRFTSPDEFKGGFDGLDGQAAFAAGPIPYADIGDPQTLNKYVYVRNNPLRYVDPNGHCFWDACIGEGYVTAVAVGALATATAAYLASPSGQQALQATGQLIQSGVTGLQNLVTQATGNNSQQASPPPATGTGQSDAGSVPKEGVYNFPDATAPGKTYVGQSGNMPQRLSQHESSGKLAPGTEVTTQEVPGGKTSRELAEQQKINSLGGTKAQPGSQTSNVRNPVSPERLKKLTDGSNQDE